MLKFHVKLLRKQIHTWFPTNRLQRSGWQRYRLIFPMKSRTLFCFAGSVPIGAKGSCGWEQDSCFYINALKQDGYPGQETYEEQHKYLMMGLNPLDPKIKDQMEALRIFNYPYQAIEEAVVNAFYHRDYMSFEPVTIELEPDCINIMNFPGIDRSISEKTIAEGKRFVSRYYRNRRLGEFLKELDLSEGHSSGIQQYRKN